MTKNDRILAEQQRARRAYLFSDDCYGQRCRDNKREMAAMWRGAFKWGGLTSLAVFVFFAALGVPAGGAVIAIGLLLLVLFPVLCGQICASLFPGWRGLL